MDDRTRFAGEFLENKIEGVFGDSQRNFLARKYDAGPVLCRNGSPNLSRR